MSNSKTLGGERLGSGKRNKVMLHGYERSNHDLGYIWKSTMASGTLVPFLNEVALPGDQFKIDLDAVVMTHPTIGPLFGSYKVQLDVFQIPIRLYNAKLHSNALNIGMNMSQIKLPQMRLYTDGRKNRDNDQINRSCIFNYLGISGLGKNNGKALRDFNAVPYLAYWDIYKQYYANKMEEIGAMIHNSLEPFANPLIEVEKLDCNGGDLGVFYEEYPMATTYIGGSPCGLHLTFDDPGEYVNENAVFIVLEKEFVGEVTYKLTDLYNNVENQTSVTASIYCGQLNHTTWDTLTWNDGKVRIKGWRYNNQQVPDDSPHITTFPLANIDHMRNLILQEQSNQFLITENTIAPYGLPLHFNNVNGWSKQTIQEGLALKTYQSDIYNNWITTEWIDGSGGISQITAIDTSGGEFTIDTLNLAKKVYLMLNRIAVTGGTYDDWLDATYDHERYRSTENPVYLGGLSKELTFEEVISNASTEINGGTKQPLGTLAGRGIMTNKKKGGYIDVRIDEPSYIMGIVSLTPRIDYSQGNKWDVNLKTMDDFHKPQLDEIGYQDLLTDQMAYWDTNCDENGIVTYKSAGKVPAWINYMTNVNRTFGNFAIETDQMFMTLNRRYERDGVGNIKDLTTYIDPSKFNNIFADTRLDAQNFWTQIKVDMEVRRKMSAKVMPNL